MKKAKSLLVIIIATFALIAMGCASADAGASSQASPLDDLVGEWLITSNPQDITPHHILVFKADSTYEILDDSRVVYERGPMSEITETGFEYTIEYIDYAENDPPVDRYAAYSISGNTLDIEYFRDSTKEERFVGFGATRQ